MSTTMHGDYKTPGGKLVRVDLAVRDGRLADVMVSGDFFLYPEEVLSAITSSLEGAPAWVKSFSQLLPLTHILHAARRVMNDGATLGQVSGDCAVLVGVTLGCIVLAAGLFSWNE